ncbi:VPLPA-CTERM-specific exosortase XrtD [Desulfobulbus elongatus]|uniref:VPLPA-CTERM-specific exosortase XrtD n=1 Tax=Desulfobulbus elongatus TaxID=53332 RepID=UPI0004883474|nr:VPLPA-CTERM-specific exosortase XrtD [Desulfobulbus elongatus]
MQAHALNFAGGWAKILLFAPLLAALYSSSFNWLVLKDWSREDYSHGWFVPLIILYLVWEKRPILRVTPANPSWMGLLVLIPGLLLYWIGELAGEFFSQYLSFTLIVIGLCWLHLGWQKLKVLFFALAFTVAMYPPPHFLHDRITFQLKLISSELGIRLLHLYGMSAYREGNIIDLGFTQLQVVDACSGLRYLFTLVIMAILLAYLYRERLWKEIVLVLSAVPITLVINAVRIAVTGILYKFWGPAVAEGFFHDFAGIFVFVAGLGVLLFEMWLLSGFRPMRTWGLFAAGSSSGGSEEAPARLPATASQVAAGGGIGSFLRPHQSVVALILLASTLVAVQVIDFREKTPPAKPFAQFPVHVGQWQGVRGHLDQDIIDRLDLSDYTTIDYRGPDGKTVSLYVAYYQSQTKGESIHSPETCLPGSGWKFEKSGVSNLPVVAGRRNSLPVNSAVMSKGENRQLVYYWFPQRDRIVTSTYALKFYNFWDALTRQRTDGALVRLITPVYPDERIEDARVRLTAFAGDMMPVLSEYLPE